MIENSPERRRFLRLAASLPVAYSQVSATQQSSARTADVGAQGVQLIVEEPLSVGSHLAIELRLAERVIHFVGEIVWRQSVEGGSGGWSYQVGVKFLTILPKDHEAIVRLVEQAEREGA